MFGAKWLRSRLSGLGLIVIGLAAFGVPAAHAVTVHPHHTETAEPHDGAPWQPGFGGGGLTHFHVSFNSFESSTAISNANIFRSESFFSNGQGSERVWSFSGQHVLSYERLRTFLRDRDCEDGCEPAAARVQRADPQRGLAASLGDRAALRHQLLPQDREKLIPRR